MSEEFSIPWFADHGYVVSIFAIFLIAFHLVLVRWIPQTSITWKKIDYVWLSFAFLGIIGAISVNKIELTKGYASYVELRAEADFESVSWAVSAGTSEGVCRKFTQGEFSPPKDEFDKLQLEYDKQCSWFRDLVPAVQLVEKNALINLDALHRSRPKGGSKWNYEVLDENVNRYNETVMEWSRLTEQARPDFLTSIIQFLAPALLAIALALRITKVTGEIQIEQEKKAVIDETDMAGTSKTEDVDRT